MKKIHNKITIRDGSLEIVFSGIVEDTKHERNRLEKIYPKRFGFIWSIKKNIYQEEKQRQKKKGFSGKVPEIHFQNGEFR